MALPCIAVQLPKAARIEKIEVFLSLVEILQQTASQTTKHCLLKQIGGEMKNPEGLCKRNKDVSAIRWIADTW
ncbi:hypothetical protein [Ochrobactrum sp. Marseille-Q0166]|uniref:hypothetical protein n=1 Tax=Ochrobactrum sp. Marseille-Q0166 TaxID=2761105 RepID=UPI0016558C36|nr:hypothetical protein [Ochrobactrum sp. Marseille-Q0166]MBC8716030.1 hypothetical protein [Ochrobactrum sp. Marseille-Q0166]